MEESDLSEGYEEGDEGTEETLNPDNPEHYFPLMEKNFNQVIILYSFQSGFRGEKLFTENKYVYSMYIFSGSQ